MIHKLHSDIFFSYSHADSSKANSIVKKLKKNRYSVFRDVESIKFGDEIEESVKVGLENCDFLVVLLTKNSINSHWVPYEIGQARALNKKILPIVFGEITPPEYIKKLKYISDIDDLIVSLENIKYSNLVNNYLSPKNVLFTIYISLLICAVVGGSKVIEIFQLPALVTVISFAFTYLVTDIVHQMYGKNEAKKFILPGIIAMLITVCFLYVFIEIDPNISYFNAEKDDCYRETLKVSKYFFFSGLIALLISQFIDIRIFQKLMLLISDTHKWLRNFISTIISQFIDTAIFIIIAFYIFQGDKKILPLILGQYSIKIIIAIIAVPIFLASIKALSKRS